MAKKNIPARVISLVLCMLLLFPAAIFGQQASTDYSGHWAEKNIQSFVEKGFITLDKDGSFKPDNSITRAELAAIANKAFGFAEKDTGNFKDVKTGDAFFNDMAAAKKAGYLVGLPDGTVRPNDHMTRQEYAVIITKLLKLDTKTNLSGAETFKDAAKIPAWSKGAISAVVKQGYMQGNPDNTFGPTGLLTKGQAVAVLERCYLDNVKVAYDKAGSYSAGTVEGSVAINAPDVTLENTVIKGNLIIGEGVGSGNVKLKNITVSGTTIVKGGGPNSIVIEDSQFTSIIIIKEDNKVRIVAVGKTTVENVEMQSGGKLEEQGVTGGGFGYVTIAENVDSSEPIILQGRFESVQIKADNVKLDVAAGSVGKLEVSESAANASINVASGVKVTNLVVAAKASVTGTGTIETAEVSAQGVTISAPTTTIKAAEGVKVDKPAPPAGGGNPGAPSSPGGGNNGNNTPNITISAIPAQSVNAGGTVELTVSSNPADAAVSASSNNTPAATVAFSGNKLTITGVAAGTAEITVTCSKSGYNSATTRFNVTVSAPSGISMSDDGSINEGSENGELITVKLTGMKFANALTASNWKLLNLPEGVTIGKVTRVSDTEASIALSGNSKADYDSDLTDTGLECAAAEVTGREAPLTCTSGVTFKAVNDPESISAAWAASPGTNGAEASMDADALTVTLTGGTFVENRINDIQLTGKAVTDAHITKESVTRISSKELRLELAWDGTDYDENKLLTVTIPANAYADSKGGAALAKDITCTATVESLVPTSDMALALTAPSAGGGNSINVGGGVKSGEVKVVNGTGLVVLTGAKKAAQEVRTSGTDEEAVTAGGTATAPTFTVNTGDIAAAGGTKAFVLTVSEAGKSSIAYSITVKVAAAATDPINTTSGVAIVLTVPSAGGGNSINVGGEIRSGEVNVVNGTGLVVLTATKTSAQAIYISGTDEEAVTAGGTDTAPTFAIDTADIAVAGGSKAFVLTVSESGKNSIAYSITVKVAAAEPVNPTSDMALALTAPSAGGGNSINVGGGVRSGEVNVVNGTALVVLTGTKTAAQQVAISGTDGEDVTAGGTATAPTFTMDTGDIAAAGGSKTFVLTVSEAGKSSIAYSITVKVDERAPANSLAKVENVRLTATGAITWTDVSNEDGYGVQLYKDGAARGPEVALSEDISICIVSEEMEAGGAGVYTAKVRAIGDGIAYQNGSWSEPSNGITQLAVADGLVWADEVAHWTAVANANNYDVYLYKDDIRVQTINVPAANASAGADFSGSMTADGTYVFRIIARGDGENESDSAISPKSAAIVRDAVTDRQKLDDDMALLKIPLTINTAPDKIMYSISPLPASLPNGTTVAWTSSNTSIIGNDGTIPARPAEDTIVTMTAALRNGSATDTKEFELNVRKRRTQAGTVNDSRVLKYTGTASWSDVRNESGYRVRLYKDGVLVETMDVAANVVSAYFTEDMIDHGPGLYGVSVQCLGDYITYEDGPESGIIGNMRITQLARPQNLHWEGKVAHWDSVDGAVSYDVSVYRNIDYAAAPQTVLQADAAKGVDFTEAVEDGAAGTYTFRVYAIGNTLNIATSGESVSDDIVKAEPTSNMEFALTSPGAGAGNTINVGDTVKTGTVNVVYATTSVAITGIKGIEDAKDPSVQTIAIGGRNAGAVSVTGSDTKTPVFTVDTSDISKGGRKAFTVILSEAGFSDVIYRITLTVAAKQPEFSADGIVRWEANPYATGYSLQLYRGVSKYGNAINVGADTTSYDFSAILDEISAPKDENTPRSTYYMKAAVTALGDGETHMDGPAAESNTLVQLAAIKLAYFDDIPANYGKLVLTDSRLGYTYRIILYKAAKSTPDVKVYVATKDVYMNDTELKPNLNPEITAAGEGIYYATVTSVDAVDVYVIRGSPVYESPSYLEYPKPTP